ncbi:adaptin ear-binding coat-associated protein 1 NECAP-1 [Auriscalpium vulgare]|uniref:Adaptin ear-binding coat-associated protein 1 NECAP-1 n=1 Tax=Auriscalpium vulgare TaxID=40419 RepID=A0ACB8SBQ2_9AGAM|nr:adaptin ear-binding coat-associated protein 1 NECAP-1 [Auriscalpium vulgare]
MDESVNDEIESILYIAREVSGTFTLLASHAAELIPRALVYRIPPLKTNEGHRAGDWGDLAAPLWKGRLRIIEKGNDLTINFEDGTTGALFAKAPYDAGKPPVEAVLDSSRYFVVRVEDNGRKAYIGMGFVERSDSFDFNVALQDYGKRVRARLNPPSPTEETSSAPSGPKKDYSLKEGQTFSISIPGRGSTTKQSGQLDTNLLGGVKLANASSSSSGGGAFPLLPPPPSAPKRR